MEVCSQDYAHVPTSPSPITEHVPSAFPNIRTLVIKQPIGEFNRSRLNVGSCSIP